MYFFRFMHNFSNKCVTWSNMAAMTQNIATPLNLASCLRSNKPSVFCETSTCAYRVSCVCSYCPWFYWFSKYNLADITEQPINIRFLWKFGKNYQRVTEMLRALYVDNTLKKISVFNWIKCFKDGRENATNDGKTETIVKLLCWRNHWSCAVHCP